MPDHKAITDPEIHEPKGVASASAKKVYVADGAASGTFKSHSMMGFWDYNDVETTATPIAIGNGTFTDLTDDGAGTATLKTYALDGVTDIWNTTTDRFDFTGLSLGDTVDMRIDLDIITSGVNRNIDVAIELGLGGTPFTLTIDSRDYKSAGTHKFTVWYSVYMGDANTKGSPAKLKILSDGAGDTVIVNGWYVRVITR